VSLRIAAVGFGMREGRPALGASGALGLALECRGETTLVVESSVGCDRLVRLRSNGVAVAGGTWVAGEAAVICRMDV
jgi:hypothetical protein